MAFTLIVVVLAILAGYARGGRLHNIADTSLGWTWLLFLGLGIQIAVDVAAPHASALQGFGGTALLIASYGLVLAWIAANRRLPGMLLIFAGMMLNAAVIAVNGGMPVDPDAIAAVGLVAPEVLHGKHVLMSEATRLAFLGDVFPIAPLRTVVSIGDIVLAVGLVPLVGNLMASPSGGPQAGKPAPDSGPTTTHGATSPA